MTGVLKDVIPFGLSIGNRNYLQGLNLIGLRRKSMKIKKLLVLMLIKKYFHQKIFMKIYLKLMVNLKIMNL